MHIHKVGIKNYRLLRDVDLVLEKDTTVIVGRNNSGKTSLTDLFSRILAAKPPAFVFEDFSLASHEDFWGALLLKLDGAANQAVREALPAIEVKLWIAYEADAADLGPLTDLVIDLDPACTEALVVVRFQLTDGAIDAFFEDLAYLPANEIPPQKTVFCKALKTRVAEHYAPVLMAVDPSDPTNVKSLEWSQLRAVVSSGFINAQRGLDDVRRDRDVLGKVLEALLGSAMAESATDADKVIAEGLTQAIGNMQTSMDVGFTQQLNLLLPAFSLFGYPGLADPNLRTETILDAGRLLTEHTRVNYTGVNGINLPESYSGLGTRNLIYILLRLVEFHRAFITQEPSAALHVVFIEEPEVHLHPQMQEVFVAKLNTIAGVLAEKFNGGIAWPVQFVLTTHSSHVANRASFDALRYFFPSAQDSNPGVRSTRIKDLRAGLGVVPAADREFLHKYMTLTRCDLLFADKVILIEGAAERILFPEMVARTDAAAGANDPKLATQYVSVVEVGGAYAHLFFPLLRFLELRALVVTDLDSVNPADENRACLVAEGTCTSNACIHTWFGNAAITPAALLALPPEGKVDGIRRIAYQVPEQAGHPCGRSFEDAFALANQAVALFAFEGVAEADKAAHAMAQAKKTGKKSDFALRFAIQTADWSVPLYIKEGLRWLAEGKHAPSDAVLAPAPAGVLHA